MKYNSVIVERGFLEYLFNNYNMWEKIKKGILKTVVGNMIPAHNYENATSMILKHLLPSGRQVATTHCIIPDKYTIFYCLKTKDFSNVLHWDATNVYMGEVVLIKPPENVIPYQTGPIF